MERNRPAIVGAADSPSGFAARVLMELTSLDQAPMFIPSDNGSKMTEHVLWMWCKSSESTTPTIASGSLTDRIGRVVWAPLDCVYNGRFRGEFLHTKPFTMRPGASWPIAAIGRISSSGRLRPSRRVRPRRQLNKAMQTIFNIMSKV